MLEELKMKKLVLALTAVAAFSGSALAADLPARTYTKAPAVVAPIESWTGLWFSGGFGFGMMDYQHSEFDGASPTTLSSVGQDAAGKGWLGKVGLGYDYQFMGNFVIGAFADTQWSSIGGQYSYSNSLTAGPSNVFTGQAKNDWSWAIGGRVGYVALPGLLTYFNGGYTQAHFKGVNYLDGDVTSGGFGSNVGVVLGSQTRGGWFLGGGTEYRISQFPGLFWKNEVRFSEFGNRTNAQVCTLVATSACGPIGVVHDFQHSRVYEQAATTELVYRFNWGGPVVAKY
jgi:outer membrane immunogenic protein